MGRIEPKQCAKSIYREGSFYASQCTRKWKVEEDGKRWCKQHAPSAKKARSEEASRKYQEKLDHTEAIKRAVAWSTVIRELTKHDPDLGSRVSVARDKIDDAASG